MREMIVTVVVVEDGKTLYRGKSRAERYGDRIAQAETLAGAAAHRFPEPGVIANSGAVISP